MYPSPRQFVSSAGCLVRSRHRLKPPLIALHQRQPQLDVVLGRQYNLLRRSTYTRESLRDSKEETDSNFLPNIALTQPCLLLRVSALILIPPKIQYFNPLLNFLRLRPYIPIPTSGATNRDRGAMSSSSHASSMDDSAITNHNLASVEELFAELNSHACVSSNEDPRALPREEPVSTHSWVQNIPWTVNGPSLMSNTTRRNLGSQAALLHPSMKDTSGLMTLLHLPICWRKSAAVRHNAR